MFFLMGFSSTCCPACIKSDETDPDSTFYSSRVENVDVSHLRCHMSLFIIDIMTIVTTGLESRALIVGFGHVG